MTEQEIIRAAMSAIGKRKSEKKADSSRENGKKGGRPKKLYSEKWERSAVEIFNTPKGLKVETWSAYDGTKTYYVYETNDFHENTDWEKKWNEDTKYIDAFLYQLKEGRISIYRKS